MSDFQRGQLVYVDRPHLETAAHECQEPQAYNKLTSRTQGPYRVMDVLSHAITIEKNGIHNPIYIDRATPILSSTKHATLICEIAPTSSDHSDTKDFMTKNTQQSLRTSDEYVVDKIVEHESTPKSICFTVRWFGYTSREDTYESSSRTPKHFITRYWKSRGARSNK